MDDALWYFAYGSNMCRATFIERRGMQPSAVTWGWLDGYRLCFDLPVGPGERGVANVVPAAAARTCGVLYRINAADAERLDRSEGAHRGYYGRIAVRVESAAAALVEAFTYHSTFATPGRRPSPRYLGLLLDGAAEQGLPAAYLDYLRGFELAVDERRDPQG